MKILIMAGRSGARTNALNGIRPRCAGAHGCAPRAIPLALCRAMDGGAAP